MNILYILDIGKYMLISIYVYIIYNILRINRYMHILYIETYIIYTLRAREEINGLGRSDRRRAADAAGAAEPDSVQLVTFAGQVVNDRDFGVTLERVENAPQGFWR